jgi:hypothetical protein
MTDLTTMKSNNYLKLVIVSRLTPHITHWKNINLHLQLPFLCLMLLIEIQETVVESLYIDARFFQGVQTAGGLP